MPSYPNFEQSSFVDPAYLETLTTVFYVTSSVSLLANLLVCLFHGFMTVCQVTELNRVSLRLIVFACACGVVFSAFRFAMVIPADTYSCSVDSFFVVCTDLASPFCLSMVGLHAVCVLVLNVKDPRRLEKYYYFVIFIYSVVVSVVAVAASPANYPEQYPCWIRHYFGKKDLQKFNWIWYYSLLIFPIALSALCSLVLLIRYSMERHNFATTSVRYARNNNPFLIPVISNRSNGIDPIKTFRDVIIRSTFYTLRFTNIRGYDVGGNTMVAAGVITTLQGFLVSILYFTDPAVRYTFGRFFRFLRKVYVDQYDLPPAKVSEPSPPPAAPSVNHKWSSHYDENDTWMDDEDRGATVRLSRVNHDMIAEDVLEDGTANDHQPAKHQLATLFVCQQPWDPYRHRSLAKTMHWFLTKVCRLQPQTASVVSSTSTLSYHSQPLTANTPTTQCSTSSSTGIDKQVNSASDNLSSTSGFVPDSSNEGSGDKSDTPSREKRIPTVQFDSPSSEHRRLKRTKLSGSPNTVASSPIYATTDDAQYLTPYNTKATQRHPSFSATHESRQPPGSTLFTPPLTWHPPNTSEQDISATSPTSFCRLARQSKKIRHAVLQRHHQRHPLHRKASKVSLLFSEPSSLIPTKSSFSPTSTNTTATSSPLSSSSSSIASSHRSSVHPSVQPNEDDIDRLSLLSHSLESPKGYDPLTAPPRHSLHARPPVLSITLADQDEPITTITTTIPTRAPPRSPPSPSLSHGVTMTPTTVRSLLDWEPGTSFHPARSDHLFMASDGIEHGHTTLIYLPPHWQNTRIRSSVEHWVRDYLGSRWFVVE